MSQTAFTRAEAQAKVGRRVRTHVAFTEVPEGALGTILRVDRVIDGYDGESPDGSTPDCRGAAHVWRADPVT